MVFSCGKNKNEASSSLSADQIAQLTEEAYIYALPIIMSYKTMYMYAVDKQGISSKLHLIKLKIPIASMGQRMLR